MTGSFAVEVQGLDHLKNAMKYIRRVNGVLSAGRREHFTGSEYDG